MEAQRDSWKRDQGIADRYVEATSFDTPLDFVIAREMAEELGDDNEWIF